MRTEYIWRCDLSKQYERYKSEIDNALLSVLKKGVYTMGREVDSFEKEFARYIGRSHGVAVASGTDALILALKAAGMERDDEVITTAYAPTPVATAITLAGGKPVFADIEAESCLIDPLEIGKKITKKTRFIIPVQLFGSVCDMDAISRLARESALTVIEDAAQAHGSVFDKNKAGTFGTLSCFSFYPTKNLGGYGDGGLVLTDSRKMRDVLRLLRNYGKRRNPYDSEILGFNSRLDELQAAVLRRKLRYLDSMNRRRTALVELYRDELQGVPVTFLKIPDNVKSNYHVLTVLCKKDRNGLVRFLESHKIQTNVYYPRPLTHMPPFREYVRKRERFPVAERTAHQALALPLYPELEEGTVRFIVDKIKRYFQKRVRT